MPPGGRAQQQQQQQQQQAWVSTAPHHMLPGPGPLRGAAASAAGVAGVESGCPPESESGVGLHSTLASTSSAALALGCQSDRCLSLFCLLTPPAVPPHRCRHCCRGCQARKSFAPLWRG
jgi:hypothetical protein